MPAQSNSKEEHSHDDLLDPEYTIAVLHNSITAHDKVSFELAMRYLKNTKFDLNQPVDDNIPPVLFTAINFENDYAVENLLRSDRVDVSNEYINRNALYVAAFTSNLPILNLIYSHDNNINNITYDTPLLNTITQMRSYSLIHDSNWGNEENKRKMIDWFEGRLNLPGELDIVAKYDINQTPQFEINWKGGLAMASYLLKRGANPKIENNDGMDAEFIINNLISPKPLQLFSDCDLTCKFLGEKNGILSFYATIKDRKKTKKIRVKVNYDPKELRELITSYANKIVDRHGPSKTNFEAYAKAEKEIIEKRLAQVQSQVAEANAKLDHHNAKLESCSVKLNQHIVSTSVAISNTQTTLNAYAAVTQNNAIVLANVKAQTERNFIDIQNVKEELELYKPLQTEAKLKGEIIQLRLSHQNIATFYDTFQSAFRDFLMSTRVMNVGDAKRATNKISDKVASGVDLIAGRLPFVGTFAGLISSGISKATDIYVERKWEKVVQISPSDFETYSRELAFNIATKYKDEIVKISKKDDVVKLAQKALEKAKDFLASKADPKQTTADTSLRDQMEALNKSKGFQKTLAKVTPPQTPSKGIAFSSSAIGVMSAAAASNTANAKTHSPQHKALDVKSPLAGFNLKKVANSLH